MNDPKASEKAGKGTTYQLPGSSNMLQLQWTGKGETEEANLFDKQNWVSDYSSNGTTKETFDRRRLIDRKNKTQFHIGPQGTKWDKFGECALCGTESELRCVNCPWQFYCSKAHQAQDWKRHKKNCKSIIWNEAGQAVAGKDLQAGTELFDTSTILVTPRDHTLLELNEREPEDFEEEIDGPRRPCFGCTIVIPPYLNSLFICEQCRFPSHSKACQLSPWHRDECPVFQKLVFKDWYKDIVAKMDEPMITFAVLRGILLKASQPSTFAEIMELNPDSHGIEVQVSAQLKKSTIHFIKNECKVDVEDEEVCKLLAIYSKHRLNCCFPFSVNKRLVSVICRGGLPFSLVNDKAANTQADVYSYRMRMKFRAIKPIAKGELLTVGIGIGGSWLNY